MKISELKEAVESLTEKFTPWENGTYVTWVYRSGTGHGVIEGVHKLGKNHDETEYTLRQFDHHEDEPAVVYHYGSDMHKWDKPADWKPETKKKAKKKKD